MHKIMFDDTKGSGWCIVEIRQSGLYETFTVYGSHITCTRSKLKIEHRESTQRADELWSWFLDDTAGDDGVYLCYECQEPVPEHIQALIVLHTPTSQLPY